MAAERAFARSRAALWFVLCLGLPSVGCRRNEGNDKEDTHTTATARRAVHCVPAEGANLAGSIELRGTIAPLPERDAQVAAQVTGRITHLLVREGDFVTSGQIVARIDDAPLVDEAQAADASVEKARAETKNAQATLVRIQRVFDHGIAARQEVDDATARATTATASQSEAESSARRARRQVQRATVRSPLAGVVVRVLRRPGELVDGTPATPIVEIADPSRLELTADATAADLVRIQRNQTAEIAIPALPGIAWRGTIAAKSPAIDKSTGLGVVRVSLELTGKQPDPPIGVLGTAQIATEAQHPAVVVPRQAVRSGEGAGREVILCGPDGVAHVQRIEGGDAAPGDKIAVRGLSVGQAVVIDPVLGVAEGDAIEIVK